MVRAACSTGWPDQRRGGRGSAAILEDHVVPSDLHPRLRVSISLSIAALLLSAGVAMGDGGATTIEAGAYIDFVAPDPAGPTPGSITFGFAGSPEEIAADAVLVPPADTNLAFLGGGTPTCLEVTREGGSIARLAFVAECTVDGPVTFVADAFGPGSSAYLIADRVGAPADLVEGDAAYAAMIGVPADSGANVAITFIVDLASGVPSSFVGRTQLTGVVTLLGSGDVVVGAATLLDAVVDDASRALLSEAAGLGVAAIVDIVGEGLIGGGGEPSLTIALSVTYTVPTPAPTATPASAALPDTRADQPGAATPWPFLVGLVAAVAIAGTRARRSALTRPRAGTRAR